MIESIPVPSDIKNRLDQLKKPGDSYGDVIEKLLIQISDGDDHIDEETDLRILKGLEDVDSGKHRPLRDIANDMGI